MKCGVFTYDATVDWIGLEITLAERSNFWTVQEALRDALRQPGNPIPYVEPLDQSSGNAATVFRFRLQDPKRAHCISQALLGLRQRFDIKTVNATSVEVAFDTYRTGGSVRHLAEIATDRYRFLTSAPGDDWYFYRMTGENRRFINTLDQRRDIVKRFEEHWQLTDRHTKKADVRYHLYVKTRDADAALLPQNHRARMEVTLQLAALPFSTVEEIERFDFATLAKHFKFRRLSDDLHPAARYTLADWSKKQIGRRGKYRRPNRRMVGRYSGTSIFKCSTVADDQLNEAAYECLRKLTRNWHSKGG